MQEGYVMALQDAVDDYVHAILHDVDAVGDPAADLGQRRWTGGRE